MCLYEGAAAAESGPGGAFALTADKALAAIPGLGPRVLRGNDGDAAGAKVDTSLYCMTSLYSYKLS